MKRNKIENLRLEGKNFYLRNLKFSDINKKYLSWLNDKAITQYLYKPKDKYSKNWRYLS